MREGKQNASRSISSKAAHLFGPLNGGEHEYAYLGAERHQQRGLL